MTPPPIVNFVRDFSGGKRHSLSLILLIKYSTRLANNMKEAFKHTRGKIDMNLNKN